MELSVSQQLTLFIIIVVLNTRVRGWGRQLENVLLGALHSHCANKQSVILNSKLAPRVLARRLFQKLPEEAGVWRG